VWKLKNSELEHRIVIIRDQEAMEGRMDKGRLDLISGCYVIN
jgi:hypothetical protein